MTEKHHVSELLRRQVHDRAKGRCEYCLIHEDDVYMAHEIDHIIAEKPGGPTVLANLAWACSACNRYKGTDLGSLDPLSNRLVPFFHPRKQVWSRHFRLAGVRLEPLTASGRATAFLLRFNEIWRIDERRMLLNIGRYP